MPLFTGCKRDPGGLVLYVVDDVDCLPPDLLANPKLRQFPSPVKLGYAINEYAKQHQLQRNTLVIVNTSKYTKDFNLGAYLDHHFKMYPDQKWEYEEVHPDWDADDDALKEPEIDALEEQFNQTFNRDEGGIWNPPM